MAVMSKLQRRADLESDPTDEADAFRRLQIRLPDQFRRIFHDASAPRTVLILPSLSLDHEVMAKVSGFTHYEERMLCLLMLLRLPRTRVIYLTSEPIPDAIIDYYLHLLPGIPRNHALQRLTLLYCHDGSAQPLAAKILARPRLVERIRQAIPDPESAHMTCYNVTDLERRLAVRLGIPIYGCDPDLLHIASKSGSRQVLREAGLTVPDGYENLADIDQVVEALAALKQRKPELRRAVVKLNEGFSGEGNAVFSFVGAEEGAGLAPWIRERLPRATFEARDMTWKAFNAKIGEMGAIVEAFIEGQNKRSPSAQYRIDPLGRFEIVSTHDQLTGGNSGQIFLGCSFPADSAYALDIQDEGLKVAKLLRKKGVLGRFCVDFVSVPEDGGWRHYAVEINIRKGGTTHPFLMLQFLTDGTYNPATGLYDTGAGQPCYYYASDNLEAPNYVGLTPEDLIDIAVENGLHFHGATQQGVVFHLIGALSEFGKIGVLCVADSFEGAKRLYEKTITVLDREGQRAASD